VSVRNGTDPGATLTRTIRRLGHLPAVQTSYASRDDATTSIEALREEATRQGYEEGYSEGLAQASRDATRTKNEESQRVAEAVSALQSAVAALQQMEGRLRSELQAAAPELAFDLLEALLGRQSELTTDAARESVARALALDEGTRPATVRLHPVDVETLGDLHLARDVVVIADAGVEPGGALVEIDDTVFDGQLGTALERVRQVLLGSAAPETGHARDRYGSAS
jgi:flagellar assembly protein FliH